MLKSLTLEKQFSAAGHPEVAVGCDHRTYIKLKIFCLFFLLRSLLLLLYLLLPCHSRAEFNFILVQMSKLVTAGGVEQLGHPQVYPETYQGALDGMGLEMGNALQGQEKCLCCL